MDNIQTIPLSEFVTEFGAGLLANVERSIPPVYSGEHDAGWDQVLDGLSRKPFFQQRQRIHAATSLLVDQNERAVVINGEMGTGKTMMGVCAAELLRVEGYPRTLVICPPHLVYKWRREIKDTVPQAKVWILNGPDTLAKLIQMREAVGSDAGDVPEYFIMGRVRMRMGFNWRPCFNTRIVKQEDRAATRVCICPGCGADVVNEENETYSVFSFPADKKLACKHCCSPLWQLDRPKSAKIDRKSIVKKSLLQLPTIGEKRAEHLLAQFGEDVLGEMLEDNLYEFINLFDAQGNLVFSDRQAARFERSMANLEFSFGSGGYQPTEFIKRYLPNGYFGSLIVDEGHEYKNEGSAQGQAMGVLSMKCRKVILLTGTLMGGYADDLFHLLWRLMPQKMVEDGFRYNSHGSIGTATMAFMRQHGVLQDVYKIRTSSDYRTAKGKKATVNTKKAPGFGPLGIARYVLPFTVFLKLKDLNANVLPSYDEALIEVEMTEEMRLVYDELSSSLTEEMRKALARGDTTLLGLVLTVILAWPDCCFRRELVTHPRNRTEVLADVPPLYGELQPMPKEQKLIELCRAEKANNRRVLVYTVYSGKRDTTARLKSLLAQEGFKVAVLRSSVSTDKREDWILDQVDRGIDVLVCNPELVKTGLDLLEFPTIIFMQSGYNVYTVQQASRRSWRIGQTEPVRVYYLGYSKTAQTQCLSLMASKIQVSQSTSGEMPETGLDVLNSDGDSIETALAKQLLAT